MDENKIQKFQTVIAGLLESADQKLARNPQKETENEENALEMSASTSKEKENLLEIIDYFANILVKHFYNEPQVNIALRESKFSVDQLWFFLQCVIEENRLNRLNEFFSNLEKQLKKERKKNKKRYNGKDLKEDNGNQTDTLNQKEQEKGGFTNTANEINLKKVPPNGDLKHAKKETREKVKKDAKKEVQKKELKGKKKKTKQDDPFFSYEEMENFVKEAEDKFYKEQEDSPTDDEEQEDENEKDEEFMDLNEFECSFENEKDLTYNDFFEDIEEGKTSDGEEDEKEEIDEEEEAKQQDEAEENENEYENEEAEEEKEEDVEEDDDEDEEEDERENKIEIEKMWDQEEGRAAGIERALDEESKHSRQSRKKQEMQIENAIKEINEFDDTHFNDDELSDSANEEIHDKEKIEKELIKKKHWSLTGEVFGYDRPKDSILALDVDIPKVGIFDNNDAVIKSIGKFEEDEEISNDDNEYEGNGNGKGGKGNNKQRNHVSMLTEEIELVVKQRIKNMLFDDVERKRIEDLDALTNNENKDEVNFDNLNFSKSKLSLAEEYAKKYENEIKNSQSKNKEMNLQKLEMMNLFKKIMNVCDSLSNDYFIPKPVLLNTSECKVATLNIEEAVPIILAQGNKKTPEELAVKKPLKDPKEMDKRERKALRKLKKEKRKRNLLNVYKESGGINALKERNEYLSEKNKKEKEEKSNIMKYGTASKEDLSVSKSKRRFDFNAEMKKAIDYDMKKMEKRSRIE